LFADSGLSDQESRLLQTFDLGIDLCNDFESVHLLNLPNLKSFGRPEV
jgi:hypothetical protein